MRQLFRNIALIGIGLVAGIAAQFNSLLLLNRELIPFL